MRLSLPHSGLAHSAALLRQSPSTPNLECQLAYCSSLAFRLLRFERSHIDGEAVLHIGLEHSLVGFVDLLDGDDFDIGSDAMCAAKIEHLLGLGDTADERAGEAAASEQKAEGCDGKRLRRRADEGKVAIAAEELDVRVNVVIGGDGVKDEVKAASVLLHLVGIAGNDDFVGAQAEPIFLLVG